MGDSNVKVYTSLLKLIHKHVLSFHAENTPKQAGADPRMVRIGTGTPLLTDKSCKFSLFWVILGLFWGYISHPAPPFGSRPPLFTYPGSAPDKGVFAISYQIWPLNRFELRLLRRFWQKLPLFLENGHPRDLNKTPFSSFFYWKKRTPFYLFFRSRVCAPIYLSGPPGSF